MQAVKGKAFLAPSAADTSPVSVSAAPAYHRWTTTYLPTLVIPNPRINKLLYDFCKSVAIIKITNSLLVTMCASTPLTGSSAHSTRPSVSQSECPRLAFAPFFHVDTDIVSSKTTTPTARRFPAHSQTKEPNRCLLSHILFPATMLKKFYNHAEIVPAYSRYTSLIPFHTLASHWRTSSRCQFHAHTKRTHAIDGVNNVIERASQSLMRHIITDHPIRHLNDVSCTIFPLSRYKHEHIRPALRHHPRAASPENGRVCPT